MSEEFSIKEYYDFVRDTDMSHSKPYQERKRIAVLGLVSEIGSILSALKKDKLVKTSLLSQSIVRGELREEIGDALWYAVQLADVLEKNGQVEARDIFETNIRALEAELTSKDAKGKLVQETLGHEKVRKFIEQAKAYFALKKPTLDTYQDTAYLTARTENEELRDISAAVLQQLCAQITRYFLPAEELKINQSIEPKLESFTLGEIVWHLAALANIFSLSLNEIVDITVEKAKFRNVQGKISSRHDIDFPTEEKFPDKFEVRFSQQAGKAVMHWIRPQEEPLQLGASLGDNSYDNDGYRFHDAVHLAFAVHLGWSPNLRKFMGLKRRSNVEKDNVEDGGRAMVVEETVILNIHNQAKKLNSYLKQGIQLDETDRNLQIGSPFHLPEAANFEFLRSLQAATVGHEVHKNYVQDWKAAVKDGYYLFDKLKENGGGTVTADMLERRLQYRPPVKES